MAKKRISCGQVNIPTVDQTPEECEGNFIDYNCILVTERLPYFGSRAGDKLSKTLKDVLDIVVKQNTKIEVLEKKIRILETK